MVNGNGSLYARVGGETGVEQLVVEFYQRVLKEDGLGDFFYDVPMERLKKMQKEFFSIALGGPSEYSDFQLSHAHQGRDINSGHFRKFVDILFLTLADYDLSEEERYKIITHINTYVYDIVDYTQSVID